MGLDYRRSCCTCKGRPTTRALLGAHPLQASARGAPNGRIELHPSPRASRLRFLPRRLAAALLARLRGRAAAVAATAAAAVVLVVVPHEPSGPDTLGHLCVGQDTSGQAWRSQ